MRTQPPGFRWLVGGFALVATVAFGFKYRSSDEPADLILGMVCLVAACYWLVFDREPANEDREPPAETAAVDGRADRPAGGAPGDGGAAGVDRRHERGQPG
jgi:hypothetical protein